MFHVLDAFPKITITQTTTVTSTITTTIESTVKTIVTEVIKVQTSVIDPTGYILAGIMAAGAVVSGIYIRRNSKSRTV